MTDKNTDKIPSSSAGLPPALERVKMAVRIIAENRGEKITVLDLHHVSDQFDYFIIASGTSRRQLHSISEEIDDIFEKTLGDRRRSIAGYQESRWIVLDYGDIVVHLFEPEKREFYALEELWGQGKIVPMDEVIAQCVPRLPKSVPLTGGSDDDLGFDNPADESDETNDFSLFGEFGDQNNENPESEDIPDDEPFDEIPANVFPPLSNEQEDE